MPPVDLEPCGHLLFTPMGEHLAGTLDTVFSCVADPTRRAILARLALSDARVTEIARDFPISLNSTSKHIRMLERAGLVHRAVQGRDHVLSLDAAPLAEAVEWFDRYRAFWEHRLGALDALVTRKRASAKKSAAHSKGKRP